jgi:hypothetical protein
MLVINGSLLFQVKTKPLNDCKSLCVYFYIFGTDMNNLFFIGFIVLAEPPPPPGGECIGYFGEKFRMDHTFFGGEF